MSKKFMPCRGHLSPITDGRETKLNAINQRFLLLPPWWDLSAICFYICLYICICICICICVFCLSGNCLTSGTGGPASNLYSLQPAQLPSSKYPLSQPNIQRCKLTFMSQLQMDLQLLTYPEPKQSHEK